MAKWNLPEGKLYTQAELDQRLAAALRGAAALIGVKVGHGEPLSRCSCGACVTRREDHEAILALIPDAGAALDWALSEAVKPYRIALADAIRRPMGVVPASAEGLVTTAELDAAEQRRAAIRAQGDKT